MSLPLAGESQIANHASSHGDGGSDEVTIDESQITDGSLLARLAANEAITGKWSFSGGQIVITVCTEASKPASPSEGQIVWTSDTDKLYTYNGASWQEIGGSGGGAHASSHAAGGGDTLVASNVSLEGARVLLTGTDTAKPGAGAAGRLYWATDTAILYQDNGSSWVKAAVKDHADLDGVGANDHHAQLHTASHGSGQSDAVTIAESQITDGSILARLAANEAITGKWSFSGGQIVITVYTEASKPASPSEGQVIWTSDTDKLYVYDGAAWQNVGAGGSHASTHAAGSGDTLVASGIGLEGARVLLTGTDAAKPAAASAGRLYWATDTHILYHDTGAVWTKAAVADHADLDGIGANDHHNQLHASSHGSGQSDAITIGKSQVSDFPHATSHGSGGSDEVTLAESQIADGAILARLAANEAITGKWSFSGGQIVITVCTEAAKPGTPSEGQTIWTSDSDKLYVYDGAAWKEIAGGGGGAHASTHAAGGSDTLVAAGVDLTGARILLTGTDAAKPGAGSAGRLYWATDTHVLYEDNGTAWVKTAAVDHADLDGIGANDHHAQSHDHSQAGDGQTVQPAVLVIPGTAAPAQTAEGSVVWDTDDDKLTIGTGAARKTLMNVGDTPTAHAASHQDGGSDEISVAGLSGLLATAQTPATHASTHQHGGADEVATAIAGANAIPKAGAGGKLAVGWLQEVLAINDLSNVSGTPALNDYLKYDGAGWVPGAVASGGGGKLLGRVVASGYSTTSTSWVDISSTVLTITAPTGANPVLILLVGTSQNSGLGNDNRFTFTIDGTAVESGAVLQSCQAAQSGWGAVPIALSYVSAALSAASHTFRPQWKVTAGTGQNFDRLLFAVIELTQ